MKLNKVAYIALAACMLLTMQSCFQDLEQDPSFNFPEDKGDPVGEKGEVAYMAFNDDLKESVLKMDLRKSGSPTFADGKIGKAYAGGTDAYLTYETKNITLGKEFSAAFWYKMNATPDRSGILTLSPADESNPNGNKMTSGFRLFREAAEGKQILKLNVGNGTGDEWFDGGGAAAIPNDSWAHIAFTISATECAVYINGNVVKQGTSAGISFDGVGPLSIASGAPRFVEWNHKSDLSLYDELRLFTKALTQDEVKALMN